MLDNNRQEKLRVLHSSQAFNRDELDWFAEFETSVEVWKSVDNLFPDPLARNPR